MTGVINMPTPIPQKSGHVFNAEEKSHVPRLGTTLLEADSHGGALTFARRSVAMIALKRDRETTGSTIGDGHKALPWIRSQQHLCANPKRNAVRTRSRWYEARLNQINDLRENWLGW